jgi:hyperosmotically inducible periplasmic protein
MRRLQSSQAGRGYIGFITGLAFLAVIVVGAAYYFYTQDLSLQGTLHVVKETSRDAATTAKVRTALSLSKRASAFDIKVETRHGEVTLTGQVPSKQIRELAGAIAQDTLGVEQVHNELALNSSVGRNVPVPQQ